VETDVQIAATALPFPSEAHAYQHGGRSAARFQTGDDPRSSNGLRREITSVTDGNGDFQATFQPLLNEAGLYTIGADHPLVWKTRARSVFHSGHASEPRRLT